MENTGPLLVKCPTCHKLPEMWIEPAKYKSTQIFWLACREHNLLAGGKSRMIVIHNWNRAVYRAQMPSLGDRP